MFFLYNKSLIHKNINYMCHLLVSHQFNLSINILEAV